MSRATHAFKILRYSTHKDKARLGAYKFIRSASFDVGGYEWCIRFYPDGDVEQDYVAVYLELLSNRADVIRVNCDFRLVDQTTKSSVSVTCLEATYQVNPYTLNTIENVNTSGEPKFMKMSELEDSTYLRDDRLVIECDVTVEETTARRTNNLLLEEPTSPNRPNLSQDLANLLDTKEGADVTSKVEREVFRAHALVLAMRSSVFKAQFYGPLRARRNKHITIEDIQPDVFRDLLHFIYTDSMSPSMSDLGTEDKKQLIQHLLVAADRYDVQQLKDVCERALCEILNVETVVAMLALADRQNCSKLKDACIDFIISSSGTWDGVATSQEFGDLKKSCPSILVDIIGRAVKPRKIQKIF